MKIGHFSAPSGRRTSLWRCMIFLLFLGLFSGLLPSSGKASSDTVQRWMDPYWLEVPASWKPLVESREGVMFFTGAPPDMAGSPEAENLSILALGVMRQAPPKEGGYEAFLEDFEKQAQKGEARNFSSSREEILLGSLPAVLYSFSGEAEIHGAFKKVGGSMVVTKETDEAGQLTLVMLMGNFAGLEEHKERIRNILSSAREGEPPLKTEKTFAYGATSDAFRYTFGLAWASDGVLALGDSRNCRIRLFDAEGKLLEEWGEKGKGEEGTFSYPRDFAFAPEGSLWVAEEGYSVRARLQRFSRKGEFLQKIDLSPKVMGEKGIYKPSALAVTDSGNIAVAGVTDIRDGKARILVFAPSGELLAAWEPEEMEEVVTLATLPGDLLVLTELRPKEGKGGFFRVYDLKGNKLHQWPFYGTDLPATLGDEEIYFRPEALASDEAGRIYAYDDAEEGLWIYDGEGKFLQVLPVGRSLGIFMGMTASPGGDVVIQDRPGGYSAGEPSLHLMKNNLPSSELLPPKVEIPGEFSSPDFKPLEKPEFPSEESAEPEKEDLLRAELKRLKKALALREEALELEAAGNIEGALAKYRESLPLHPDPAVEAYAAELERRRKDVSKTSEILAERKEETKIPEISGEAASLAEVPEVPTMPEVPDIPEIPEVSGNAETGPGETPPAPPVLSLRSPLYDEAERLEAEGRRYEALLKYEEGLKEELDPEMQAHARNLENILRREAREMVAQAVAVQNRGNYAEALRLYRQSLTLFPLKQVQEYADRLEILLDQGTQSRDARAKAEILWREGAELQKQWRYQEALKKYKEGLALSPDPKVEEHVRKLEAFLEGGK